MPDIVMSAQSDRTSDYLSWLFWDADGPEIKIINGAILRSFFPMAGKLSVCDAAGASAAA